MEEQTNGILFYWGTYVDKYVDDDEKEHYTRFSLDLVKQHMISIIIQSNEIASEFVWFVLANKMNFDIECVGFIQNMLETKHFKKIVVEFNKYKVAYNKYKKYFDNIILQCSPHTDVEPYITDKACKELKQELETLNKQHDMGIILNFFNKYKYSIILDQNIDAYKDALDQKN